MHTASAFTVRPWLVVCLDQHQCYVCTLACELQMSLTMWAVPSSALAATVTSGLALFGSLGAEVELPVDVAVFVAIVAAGLNVYTSYTVRPQFFVIKRNDFSFCLLHPLYTS